jgi:hypothetical protein
MSPLLAPILAQLVSLQVGDRTEARYVKDISERYEGSTTPAVSLNVLQQRSSLTLSYLPSLLLSPLSGHQRQLYVFHLFAGNVSYRVERHTTLSLGSSFGIGTVNFRLLALQGQQNPNAPIDASTTGTTGTTGTPTTPTPPTGTPTTGTPAANGSAPLNTSAATTRPDVLNKRVQYYMSSSVLGLTHQLSRSLQLSAQVGNTVASGRGAESRVFYPPLRGWTAGGAGSYAYVLRAQDTLNSNLSLTKAWSSNDNEVATLYASEGLTHVFDKHTGGSFAAGLNITRFSQGDGLRGISVFPVFNLGLVHQERLGRGVLSFGASAFAAPALDPLRALIDPRVGFGGNIGYSRKKLTLSSTGTTAFSVAPAGNDAGAVNTSSADVRAAYQLATLTQVDAGARLMHQTYQGANVIPFSWAVFVGLSFGYRAQLAGRPAQ